LSSPEKRQVFLARFIMKKNLLFWALLGSSLWLMNPSLRAASQAGTNLVVSVTAAGAVEVGSVAPWSDAGGMQSLRIPVKVLVRINRATDCTLSLSLLEGSDAAAPILNVETDSGQAPLSESPAVLRRYSHSGTFSESIVVTRSPAPGAVSGQLRFLWALSSSDGAISWSATTPVSLPAPLAGSVSVPAAQ
jgi:hypothetical protein